VQVASCDREVRLTRSHTFDGGCACGALRFSANADPLDAGYCHCRICQRTTGAPVLAWASFPVSSFTYTRGEPSLYPSSNHGHRELCAQCGTQIAYRDNVATTVDVNVGSLDEPERITPTCHIWCESQIPWLTIEDDLPRFVRSKAAGERYR
jgi:hypothetical protein